MEQTQRRASESQFIVLCLILTISALGGVAMGREGRFKLRDLYPAERVAEVLLSRDECRFWPRWSNREAWEGLPDQVRQNLIANGQAYLGYDWPDLPATLFLEFARNGNRSHYEREHFARRGALTNLLIAECAEGQGRFLDDIVNGIWAMCEESFWGVPAHVGAQKAGSGLPDPTEPIVALFVAETGESLAWTYHLLAEQLDGVSPLVRQRIEYETNRRILTPCLERDDFGWMGFRGRRVNNWNPWCNASWLTCALLVEPDEDRRVAAVAKIMRSLDHFFDAYEDDGGCDEGPGYWGRAGASLFDCLELLHGASRGAIDVYDRPLVKEIGRYIYRVHIADDYFVNFADASARSHPPAELVHRYGKRIGDDRMAAFGAYRFARDRGDGSFFSGRRMYTIGRYLAEIFNLAEVEHARAAPALPRDVWLDGIQVMVARDQGGSAEGLFVAAKGGHNAESHNHNDVGNFIVYIDGRPVIIDIGVETYSRKTFSSRRYEIWTMQSAYHSLLPTIDGVMQKPGRQFAAAGASHEATNEYAQLKLDIAGAYPREAKLQSWRRTIRLRRGRELVVTDQYALQEPAREITASLMTPCKVAAQENGQLLLVMPDGEPPLARIRYDGAKMQPTIETIPVEDSRLRGVWPPELTRIVFKADRPAMQDVWTYRIEPIQDQ